MISRVTDASLLQSVTQDYVIEGTLDPGAWIENENNIGLRSGEDFSFFSWEAPGVYNAHWFFKSRGKAAKQIAIEMLNHVFYGEYFVEVLLGFTPLENLGARWLARHLGFSSQGEVEKLGLTFEFFIMTKKQWTDKQ